MDPLALFIAPVVQYMFENEDVSLRHAHEHIARDVVATNAEVFRLGYMLVLLCGHLGQIEDDA